MITIIAHDPTFAAAYNLRKAFSLREETRLITLLPHERWPEDTDILLTEDNAAECRKLIERSRFTMIADASGIAKGMLRLLAPKKRDWLKWAADRRWIPFWGDKAYYYDADSYNQLMEQLGATVIFTMMDLMYLAPKGAIPLCHPVADPGWPIEKPRQFTVMHSPGTNKKRRLKGTERIEAAVNRIKVEYPKIDYITIMGMLHADCVALKKQAHVFIDQVPDPGLPAGMGRSGEEALAMGAIVITALNGQQYLKGHFETPPVLTAYTDDGLDTALRAVCGLDRTTLAEWSAASRMWAEKYLLFEGWLNYVERYIK
jgi:hypothetical protein